MPAPSSTDPQIVDPQIVVWLEWLANATAAGAEPVSAERIEIMAALLAEDGFPAGAFTFKSLHHCTEGQRFFPSHDDLRKSLHRWWDANRPPAGLQLPGPVAPDLDATDRHWLAYWHKRLPEISAATSGRDAYEAARGRLASLVQAQSPRAWAAINGEKPATPAAPTEEQKAGVARLLHPDPTQPGADTRPAPAMPPPFRDVTARGEALARIRASGRKVTA